MTLIKNIIIFLLALVIFIAIFPVLILLAFLIRIKLGSPVLFTQARIGKDGRQFKLYKFRTMTNQRDDAGNLLPDEARLTKFGSFLRKASLDELPSFINVLKGDIAFVGPRPLLPEYMELYTKEQHKRHNVKPGITGLAQVNGRNAQSWEERFEYDVYYVENKSLLLDIKIILKTLSKVITAHGVSAPDQATMEHLGDYLRRTNKIDKE